MVRGTQLRNLRKSQNKSDISDKISLIKLNKSQYKRQNNFNTSGTN